MEINEVENKNDQRSEKINESYFSEKINKTHKSPGRLISNKWEQQQFTNIRNGRADVTTESTDIKGIIRKCYE